MPNTSSIVRSVILFVLAGVCEVGGGWLVWKWLRDHQPGWWGLLGGLILILYGVHVAIGSDGEVIVACSSDGTVSVLTPSLQVVHAFDLGAKLDGISASPDGRHVGLSWRDRICLTDLAGKVLREVRHQGWSWYTHGGCAFAPDGSRFWTVRPAEDQGSYLLEVFDCGGWHVEASASFEPEAEGGFSGS
jgi:hypothetical protein